MTARQRLRQLYRILPKVQCQGKCQEACGPIACSETEADIMQRVSGKPLTFDAKTGRCGYLNEHGRCSVYDARPLVCRVFGASEKLPCVWGCKPAAPLLSEQDEGLLFLKVLEVGGGQPMMLAPDDPALFDQLHPKTAQLQGRTLQYGPYLKAMGEPCNATKLALVDKLLPLLDAYGSSRLRQTALRQEMKAAVCTLRAEPAPGLPDDSRAALEARATCFDADHGRTPWCESCRQHDQVFARLMAERKANRRRLHKIERLAMRFAAPEPEPQPERKELLELIHSMEESSGETANVRS